MDDYPHLAQGSNRLLLLDSHDGRFEWSSLLKKDQKKPLRLSHSAAIFPPTRPPQDLDHSTTILKNAEQGANFLRTYHPDLDVPAELIRDQLLQDATIARAFNQFDPYTANILTHIDLSDIDQSFLAFPMGPVFRDLNLSPFRCSEKKIIFKPVSHPVRTFETPIQQISASRAASTGAYLAVRTFSYTSLLQFTGGASPTLTEVTRITHADTRDRSLVDFSFSSSPFKSLAVNDLGALYVCDIANGKRYMDLIYSPGDDASSDFFWRVGRSADDAHCFLASSKVLKEIDVRSRDILDLFVVKADEHVLTSVEDERQDNIVRLCSTQELLWIDRRFPGKPLLAYSHGREFDRSLDAQTIPTTGLTLLTSRKNKMITVYDVSCRQGFCQLNHPPHCLFSTEDTNSIHLGQTFLSPTLVADPGISSFIRLSDRGSLHQIDLETFHPFSSPLFETTWSEDVKRMSGRAFEMWAVPYDTQDFTEVDLSPVYEKIFSEGENEDPDAVYELAARIPTFWQEAEVPIEHMLTTYEGLVRAGNDPDEVTRADFFVEGGIHSREGYNAVAQGRLSAKEFMKNASWCYSVGETIALFDPDFSKDIMQCREGLRRYDLVAEPTRSVESIEQEQDAQEQLALDLALSVDVFSQQGFLKPSDELESMAKTLSLAEEPRLVEFGYFRPVAGSSRHGEEEREEGLRSAGVRSLLKSWKTGVDVAEEDIGTAVEAAENGMGLSQLPEMGQSQPPAVVRATTVDGVSQPIVQGGRKRGGKDRKRVGGF